MRAHRLVTLTGAGGSGKTRLGLAVAGELTDIFASGLWVVELAPISCRERCASWSDGVVDRVWDGRTQ